MMHYLIKKVISLIIGFCCIGSASSVFVGWYLVKRFTARPIYSANRIAEHERNKLALLNDLKAQRIQFNSTDGIRLSGYLLVRPEAEHIILLCHGYRMCKERMYSLAKMFPNDTILLFDHRAHGESEGQFTTFGHLEQHDVLAAVEFLQMNGATKSLPIIGIGVSMGAVSLLAVASQCEHFKAVVLDSPFLRLDRQARKLLSKRYKLPELPIKLFGEQVFARLMNFSMRDVNALNWAKIIQVPTLVIHSTKDDTVPITDSLTLFDAMQCPKDFWKVETSGHARIFNDCFDEYKLKLQEFFSKIL